MKVIEDKSGRLKIVLSDDPPVNRFKPSVDFLFNSVSKLDVSKRTSAALLTGMGDDGASGLLALRQAGAFTIAQDEASCVVFGMPKAAIERNAAVEVADLAEIAELLFQKVHKAGRHAA
jgi:two-component system chemotaxis response regulator CheB